MVGEAKRVFTGLDLFCIAKRHASTSFVFPHSPRSLACQPSLHQGALLVSRVVKLFINAELALACCGPYDREETVNSLRLMPGMLECCDICYYFLVLIQ